jgi:hypothetical protein
MALSANRKEIICTAWRQISPVLLFCAEGDKSMVRPLKIDLLRTAAARGDWVQALSIAAKFHNLGTHKAVITRAHNAIQSPGFYLQIGQDPTTVIKAGIAALKERYRL